MRRALCWSCLVVLLSVVKGWAQVKPGKSSAEKPQDSQGEDFLGQVQKINTEHGSPPSDFREGHVTPRVLDAHAISKTAQGFSIKMPSRTPVPTPAVHEGRLYSGGGFSCKEFYCFDARSGKMIWGVNLDDDGPSSPVVEDGTVIFNAESCTIFALEAATGKLLWAHWLGDPLMSMPAVSEGRVFAAYPVADAKPEFKYALAAFGLKTGEVLWQRWIDSDCLSAPVVHRADVYLATLSGCLYCVAADDGRIKSAQKLRATSAPVVSGNEVFLTRRDDAGGDDHDVVEAIAAHDVRTGLQRYLVHRRAAPYLDHRIQRASAESAQANAFEDKNGIKGGFGGGFGAIKSYKQTSPQSKKKTSEEAIDEDPPDALASEQLKAAKVIGKGNVHTIQGFQGSRLLHWADHNFNCMGDTMLCTTASSGELVWSRPIVGDLKRRGGHLAAPPVLAGGQLFVAQLSGEVLQIDPKNGEVAQTHDVGAALRFPPVIEDGWLYVGTQDGRLVGINTENQANTGWPMWGADAAHSGLYRDKN